MPRVETLTEIYRQPCSITRSLRRSLMSARGHERRFRLAYWMSASPDSGGIAYIPVRPDNPWQHIKARQSLSARPVRSGRLGRAGQARAKAVGTPWAQILDRSGEEATTPQCARHCARQQARPHRVGGSQQGARLRVRQDRCGGVPSSLILAPCSGPSRRGLAAWTREVRPRDGQP